MNLASAASFSVTFTPCELFWLLSAFSHTPPESLAFSGQPTENMSQQLAEGYRLLEQRGFLRRNEGGPHLQVDHLAAGVIEFLCNSDNLIIVRQVSRIRGAAVPLSICQRGAHILLVERPSEDYVFTFFESFQGAIPRLLTTLDLEPQKSGLDKRRVTLPDPANFIPLAWRDAQLAHTILSRSGFSPDEIAAQMKWCSEIDTLTILATGSRQMLVARAGEVGWRSGLSGSTDAVASFTPALEPELRDSLETLFQEHKT